MLEFIRERLLNEFAQHNDKERLIEAMNLAEQTHAGQYRKPHPSQSHRDPYIIHPMRVALVLLQEIGVRDFAPVAAALLHDVIEDSDGRVTADDLTKAFGADVANIVNTLSKPPYAEGVERHVQLSVYHDNINNAPEVIRLVKLADRLDNIRESLLTNDDKFQDKYLKETKEIYIPLAASTSDFFHNAIVDVCNRLEDQMKAK